MAQIVQFRVRCPKCKDGLLDAGRVKARCPYCAGEGWMEPGIAKAIRATDREVAAFWCDCTDLSTEVYFNRTGIFCVECNKMVQEEFGLNNA